MGHGDGAWAWGMGVGLGMGHGARWGMEHAAMHMAAPELDRGYMGRITVCVPETNGRADGRTNSENRALKPQIFRRQDDKTTYHEKKGKKNSAEQERVTLALHHGPTTTPTRWVQAKKLRTDCHPSSTASLRTPVLAVAKKKKEKRNKEARRQGGKEAKKQRKQRSKEAKKQRMKKG